jgi:hypothetical protein
MPTPAQLAMMLLPTDAARCEALFASGLQPSDIPTAEMVTKAIDGAVQQLGIGGCVGRMAQEFGDHPEAAATRMRWVRQLTAQTSGTGPCPGTTGRPRRDPSRVHAAEPRHDPQPP